MTFALSKGTEKPQYAPHDEILRSRLPHTYHEPRYRAKIIRTEIVFLEKGVSVFNKSRPEELSGVGKFHVL
jgi:hypothetical protein